MKNKFHLNKIEKFIILLLILVIYTFLMIEKYGIENGPIVSILTWSFFVFCTPIADAGFLIDFPIRLLTKVKMIYSEIIVWVVAFIITLSSYLFNPTIFDTTIILKLFYQIITNLFPYGIIIILSAIGTFLSVYFGEEILDESINELKKKKRKKHMFKYKYLYFILIIVVIIIVYYYLLSSLGISI